MLVTFINECVYGNIGAYKYRMYHILRVSQYWSFFGCSTHIILSVMWTRMSLIHILCTNVKNHGNHSLPGFWWIVLQTCLWCVSSSPPQRFWKQYPLKMLAKRHTFLVQGATRVSLVQHHTHVVPKYRFRFGDLHSHLSKVIWDHYWRALVVGKIVVVRLWPFIYSITT